MKPLRIGILSTAHVHADGFAEILRTTANLEVVGFSQNNSEAAKKFVETSGLKHFATHRALIDQGLDAVIICSETALHLPLVTLAARAGAHILCEKPIATTLEDAIKMREVCEQASVQFMTAYPMRFDPNLMTLKQKLEQPKLGKVLGIVGINHAENPMYRQAWFANKQLAGGGAIMDHTVHLTDLYRWLLNLEVSSVQAEISNPFYPELDIDSAGFITMTLGTNETRVITSSDSSWSRPVGVYPRWGHLKLEIYLENAAFEIDGFANRVNLYSKNTTRATNWLGYGADATRAMLNTFLEAVSKQKPVPITWQDGFAGLQVALASYQSSKTGQVIYLES